MIPEFPTTLLAIEDVARDTKKFLFSKPQGYEFKAGQFLSMKFTDRAWRAYSIASLPNDEHLELVIRLVEGGVASTVLKDAKVGDEFLIRGPFGHFVLSENEGKSLVFCGTGTGIAPFKSMIKAEAKKENPRPMALYYGGRNADDIAYLDEVASWAPNLKIFLGFSRELSSVDIPGAVVAQQRITTFLEETDFPENTEVYICGNGDMVVSVRAIFDEKGFSKDQIFQERFN